VFNFRTDVLPFIPSVLFQYSWLSIQLLQVLRPSNTLTSSFKKVLKFKYKSACDDMPVKKSLPMQSFYFML